MPSSKAPIVEKQPTLHLEEEEPNTIDSMAAKDLNLAFWYIKKIGSIERALKLVKVAGKAIQELAG